MNRPLFSSYNTCGAKLLLPDTTGHLQWSCGVHVLTGQCCSGSTKGTYAKLAGGLNVVALLNIILKLKGGGTAGMILSEKQDLWSQLTCFE